MMTPVKSMPTSRQPRMIAYTRVSTNEQGDSGLGLAAQITAIEAYAAAHGWTLIPLTDVSSGKNTRRQNYQSALELLRANKADGIVASKLDRLSRSSLDFARLMEEADHSGFNVVVLDLGLDLATPHGRFLADIMSAVSQLERSMISQRTKDALAVKRSQGHRLGAKVRLPRAVSDRVVRMQSDGFSLSQISDQLNEDGIPSATGQRWTRGKVDGVLRRLHRAQSGEFSVQIELCT